MNNVLKRESCIYCDDHHPLVTWNTADNEAGISIEYPNELVSYGFNVEGLAGNGLSKKIKYCPMCGRNLEGSFINE